MVIVSRKFNMPIGSIVERAIYDPTSKFEVKSDPYTDEYGDTTMDIVSVRNGDEWQAYPQYYRPAV